MARRHRVGRGREPSVAVPAAAPGDRRGDRIVGARVVALAIGVVAAVAVSYAGWSGVRTSGRSPAADPAATAAAFDLAPNSTSGRELERLIGQYEQVADATPNATALTFLAQLYTERGRLTNDIATYVRAQSALQQAVQLFPGDVEARALLAQNRATLHDFPDALAMATALLDEQPRLPGALAVAFDAQLELGHYSDAGATLATLALVAPDAPAEAARAARFAFVNGRVDDADQAYTRAEDLARRSALSGPSLAWYTAQRAQLAFDRGRYDESARLAQNAVDEAPDYPVALAALAKARAGQGRRDDAIDIYRGLVERVPQPEYVGALGDLEALTGDDQAAQHDFDTVGVIARLAAANQQVFNRQVAVFDADHAVRIDEAVDLTTGELTVRHDVYGWDASAWSLLQAGRVDEARAAAHQAMALGTPDARILYHAGMIERAAGDTTAARDLLGRALATSPNFDPRQAPIARRTLAELG